MLTIEVRFKVNGWEVMVDGFADMFASKLARAIGSELERKRIATSRPEPWLEVQQEKPKGPDSKAVGINETAQLLGVSSSTVRNYAAQGRIHTVHVGRRVLVPMETIQQVLREGVPRKTP